MTKISRIKNFLQGIVMILASMIVLIADDGYIIIVGLLGLALLIYGFNQLLYYLSMAKYMVGGNIVLCKALLVLNLGMEAIYITDVPKLYIMLYLIMGIVFGGLVDVLHAFDIKRREGIHWKLKLIQGLITITIALVGLFYVNTTNIVVYIYCFGLLSKAITKITEAFRKTSFVIYN